MFERESEQSGLDIGRWQKIERRRWQDVTLESAVFVPAAQAGIIAVAWGLVVLVAAGVVCAVAHLPAEWVLVPFVLVTAFFFALRVGGRIEAVTGAELQSDVYDSGRVDSASASRDTIRIERWIRYENGGGRAEFDEFTGVPRECLALAVKAENVSRRELVRVGVPERVAERLLAQLIALKYATASTDNAPGVWTESGRELRRAFFAGGAVVAAAVSGNVAG